MEDNAVKNEALWRSFVGLPPKTDPGFVGDQVDGMIEGGKTELQRVLEDKPSSPTTEKCALVRIVEQLATTGTDKYPADKFPFTWRYAVEDANRGQQALARGEPEKGSLFDMVAGALQRHMKQASEEGRILTETELTELAKQTVDAQLLHFVRKGNEAMVRSYLPFQLPPKGQEDAPLKPNPEGLRKLAALVENWAELGSKESGSITGEDCKWLADQLRRFAEGGKGSIDLPKTLKENWLQLIGRQEVDKSAHEVTAFLFDAINKHHTEWLKDLASKGTQGGERSFDQLRLDVSDVLHQKEYSVEDLQRAIKPVIEPLLKERHERHRLIEVSREDRLHLQQVEKRREAREQRLLETPILQGIAGRLPTDLLNMDDVDGPAALVRKLAVDPLLAQRKRDLVEEEQAKKFELAQGEKVNDMTTEDYRKGVAHTPLDPQDFERIEQRLDIYRQALDEGFKGAAALDEYADFMRAIDKAGGLEKFAEGQASLVLDEAIRLKGALNAFCRKATDELRNREGIAFAISDQKKVSYGDIEDALLDDVGDASAQLNKIIEKLKGTAQTEKLIGEMDDLMQDLGRLQTQGQVPLGKDK